jgi:hypothetical protein
VREYPVEHDYNYLGNFNGYQSFGFMDYDNGLDSISNLLIKKSITNHLELLGYSYDGGQPGFLVNYFYFSDSLKYKGYDQPEMESFLKGGDDRSKRKERYIKKDFKITNGTFVINFTDQENYSMIWQGYTTDLYQDQIFEDPRKTRIAVISVLKSYSFVPQLNSY